MDKSKATSRRIRAIGAITLAIACTAAWLGCTPPVSDKSIGYVRTGDLAKWIEKSPDKYLILDSRGPEEYDAGHIPGAQRMTLPQLDPDNIDPALGRYSAIIVYGENPGSGVARAMTKRLIQARLTEVYLLDGGIAAWRASGGRIVSFGVSP